MQEAEKVPHQYNKDAKEIISLLCDFDFSNESERFSPEPVFDITRFKYSRSRIVYTEGGAERSSLTHSQIRDTVRQVEGGDFTPLLKNGLESHIILHQKYGLTDESRLMLLESIVNSIAISPFTLGQNDSNYQLFYLFREVLLSSPDPANLVESVVPFLRRSHLSRRALVLARYNISDIFRGGPKATAFVDNVHKQVSEYLRSASPASEGYFGVLRASRRDFEMRDLFQIRSHDLRWTKQFFEHITCRFLSEYDWEKEFKTGRFPESTPSLEDIKTLNRLVRLRAENRKLLSKLTKLVCSRPEVSS